MYSGNKIIGDLNNGEIRIFFVFLEQIRTVFGVFRGALRVPNFFVDSTLARNGIPAKKLLAISKTAKLDFFLLFLEQIRVVLGVFRGTCIVANFFIASLCARNGIPAIKLLAISKTDEVDFLPIFEGEWVVDRVSRYLHRYRFFL